MIERRSAERIPVDLWATVVSDDGLTRIAVNVLNQTRQGIRVALDPAQPLPACFYILMPGNLMHAGQVIWQDAMGAGIRFVD